MNTMGDLICTGVDVSFPDDTLSLGDFPTTIKAVVKLKPAKPRDRAGIEMMFNHGKKRIYMPAVVKVVRDQQVNSTKRGLWDKYISDGMEYAEDWVKKEVVENGKKVIKWELLKTHAPKPKEGIDALKYSISESIKYAQEKQGDMKVWINNKSGKDVETQLIKVKENVVSGVSNVSNNIQNFSIN